MSGSVIERPFSVGMVVAKLGTNGDQLTRPPGNANRVLRIIGGKPSPAPNLVFKVLVSYGEKGVRCKPEHCVVQHRPFRCVAVPHWKRTALERHLLVRLAIGSFMLIEHASGGGLIFSIELFVQVPTVCLGIV